MGTAILDIDGTLVDSNYFHAIAWYRAFRDHDHTLPMWRIHRAIPAAMKACTEILGD